jgi:hypothetical protein
MPACEQLSSLGVEFVTSEDLAARIGLTQSVTDATPPRACFDPTSRESEAMLDALRRFRGELGHFPVQHAQSLWLYRWLAPQNV